jgi:hypothetical protein
MLTDDELDEYVTQILLNDAKRQKASYSTLGFRAFLKDAEKDGPVGKPNTRFLRNIVRDVDHHNAALARKEERESRQKLREMSSSRSASVVKKRERSKGLSRSGSPRRHRSRTPRRKRGSDDDRGTRRRDYSSDGELRYSRHHKRSHRRTRDCPPAHSNRSQRTSHRERHDRTNGSDSDDDRSRHRRTSREHSHRHGHERRKERDTSEDTRKRHRRRSSRSRSPGRPRHHRNSIIHELKSDTAKNDRQTSRSPSLGPDILIEGPEYLHIKGRGTMNGGTPLDKKFSPTYDPRNDTRPSPPASPEPLDDWGQALRALRARREHVLSTAMTSRLDETQVQSTTWPTYSKGEREWDKGKVIMEDGSVGVNVWGMNKAL